MSSSVQDRIHRRPGSRLARHFPRAKHQVPGRDVHACGMRVHVL